MPGLRPVLKAFLSAVNEPYDTVSYTCFKRPRLLNSCVLTIMIWRLCKLPLAEKKENKARVNVCYVDGGKGGREWWRVYGEGGVGEQQGGKEEARIPRCISDRERSRRPLFAKQFCNSIQSKHSHSHRRIKTSLTASISWTSPDPFPHIPPY